jgi:tetratricopeptide (TPR) repeat protein
MKNAGKWVCPWGPVSRPVVRVLVVVGGVCAGVSGPWAPPAQAAPAAATPVAQRLTALQVAVARALYAASATAQVLEQEDDAARLTQRKHIDHAWARLGITAPPDAAPAVPPELTQSQERLVAALAEDDEDYAQAIQSLRLAVTALAATPEGLAALWRYNTGDETGALAVWDRLIDQQPRLAPAERVALRRYVALLALDARGKGKGSTRSVLVRYEALTQLDPHVYADWMALGALYQDDRQWAKARAALTRATQTARTDPERCAAFDELGDVQTEQDDLSAALQSYQTCLTLRQQAAKAHPDDLDAQNDLSVSHDSVADTLGAMEDWAGAVKHYQSSLAIRQKLVKTEPDNVDWQSDLADSHMDIGDALSAQGHVAAAAKSYQAGVQVRQALQQAEPNNPERQRDLVISLMKLSEASGQKGHAQRALKLVQQMQTRGTWDEQDSELLTTLEQLAK